MPRTVMASMGKLAREVDGDCGGRCSGGGWIEPGSKEGGASIGETWKVKRD